MRAVSCRDDFLLQIRLHFCPQMCQLSRYPSMWKALAMERQAREADGDRTVGNPTTKATAYEN